jgi:hypothetical protein
MDLRRGSFPAKPLARLRTDNQRAELSLGRKIPRDRSADLEAAPGLTFYNPNPQLKIRSITRPLNNDSAILGSDENRGLRPQKKTIIRLKR